MQNKSGGILVNISHEIAIQAAAAMHKTIHNKSHEITDAEIIALQKVTQSIYKQLQRRQD